MEAGRDEQIARVEQGFQDLAAFARDSWSNLAIVERLLELHAEVRKLYPPVVIEMPAPPPPPPPRPVRIALPAGLPADFQPVHVEDSTRWG